jgi:hypothetical protein
VWQLMQPEEMLLVPPLLCRPVTVVKPAIE